MTTEPTTPDKAPSEEIERPIRRPEVLSTCDEIVGACRVLGSDRATLGLVPTMGALHAGHLSLVDAAQAECDHTVVTVFVNPTQFGPKEDFSAYPRDLDADLVALGQHGVTLVFAPSTEEIYPEGFATYVENDGVASEWEGACRPGHFRGVTTVVAKLLNLVMPKVAYFGQKDYQQSLVIRRMVADLNMHPEIRVCPIVRESDGLALSSRNVYLSAEERLRALALSQSLRLAEQLVDDGEGDTAVIERRMRQLIESVGGVALEYIALADPYTLKSVSEIAGPTVAALAARVGSTRLIDNTILSGTLSDLEFS
ncbi:MAG: pantoate--beta-alanine ligase [Planctomycetales bacterium]|nr:pantoate--beta-alanine ligase [Planctomycetales bacterium]